MQRVVLRATIHRATMVGANLDGFTPSMVCFDAASRVREGVAVS
jgi:hypothetical protein